MKNFLLIIGLTICFAFTGYAQTAKASKSNAKTEAEIKNLIAVLEQDNDKAVVGGNKALLDSLYADDFVGVNASGGLSSKEQILSFYAGPEGSVIEMHDSDQTSIRVFDKTAIVTARLKYKYNKKIEDQTITWMKYTRIYVFRENKWRIVAEHFTFLPNG